MRRLMLALLPLLAGCLAGCLSLEVKLDPIPAAVQKLERQLGLDEKDERKGGSF